MLKLTVVAETETTATLRVQGAVVAEWGAVLEAACRKCLARKPSLVLDFCWVTLIDERSAERLRTMMRTRDIRVINCWGLIEAEIRLASPSNGAKASFFTRQIRRVSALLTKPLRLNPAR